MLVLCVEVLELPEDAGVHGEADPLPADVADKVVGLFP